MGDLRFGRIRRGQPALTAVCVAVPLLALTAACGSHGGTTASDGVSSNSDVAATGTLGALQGKGSATIGIVNQPPISGLSATGGTVGFSPELAKKILNDLGVPNMKAIVAAYGDMIPGLQAKRWDYVAATLVITPARCQQVLFSDPVLGDAVRVAYTSGAAPTTLKQLISTGSKVGILKGSAYISKFEAAGMPSSQLVEYSDIRSGLDALTSGRVSYVIGSTSGFKIDGIASSVKFSPDLSDVARTVGAFAFKKSDEALRDAVNKDLAKLIADGTYADIVKKWGFDQSMIKDLSTEEACQPS